MAADQALKRLAFGGGQGNRRRFGTTHGWALLQA
jgi:hypothetical protein